MRLLVCSSQPSSGIGTPQSRSRVIARGWSSFEQVGRELQDVRPPVGAFGQPGTERIGQRRQVEEEVLGLDEVRRLAVDAARRVDQVGRVELVAAVVALVAARTVVAADRAGALDVPVGQGAAGRGRDGAHRGLRDDVPVAVQGGEQLLHDRVVVARRRTGEQVVAEPEPGQVLDDHPVVAVGQLAGRHPLGVGLHLDRRAVLVGAADHQDVVARHPHVPAEHVGGHSEAGHVADVPRAVGVGPGDRGEDVTGHAASLRAQLNPDSRPPGWFTEPRSTTYGR